MIGTLLAQNFAHVNGKLDVSIAANPGTLLENVVPLINLHFKYKVPTISALNLMLSPKEKLVGVIKIARHPNVGIDYGFTFFSLTPIAHSSGRAEK